MTQAMTPNAAHHAEFERLWATMRIDPRRRPWLEAEARRVIAHRAIYARVAALSGVPWIAVGVIHLRESDLDFTCHLHNGDRLSARTTHVPRGRPPTGKPPFTWLASAVDALGCDKPPLTTWPDWSMAGMADALEHYNGEGYRFKGLASPYLWAGCQHYAKGKYASDGHYDPDLVDRQPGCMVLIKVMMELDPSITFGPVARTRSPSIGDSLVAHPASPKLLGASLAPLAAGVASLGLPAWAWPALAGVAACAFLVALVLILRHAQAFKATIR